MGARLRLGSKLGLLIDMQTNKHADVYPYPCFKKLSTFSGKQKIWLADD